MLFGKIDYLNLLPFHVFLKRYPLSNQTKKSIEFKKGTPAKLCLALSKRQIDAAIISSIESRNPKYKKLNLGICARGAVKSVLVRKNSTKKLDPASKSSNTSAFSWQNSITLCPVSFRILRPNLPVTPGVS